MIKWVDPFVSGNYRHETKIKGIFQFNLQIIQIRHISHNANKQPHL
jgi:hypothetical protein